MKVALVSIGFLAGGYAIGGGECGILESLYTLVWDNPLGDATHNAYLNFSDDRVTDMYGAFRMDFRYGPGLFLLGFVAGLVLRNRFSLLPSFLVLGLVARMWVPLVFELSSRALAGEMYSIALKLAPQFVWDLTLIPTSILGMAIARLVMLRRMPRWQIRDAAILTALFGLFFMSVAQHRGSLIPYFVCPIVGLLAIKLLFQTDAFAETLPNKRLNVSGGPRPT